MMNVIIGWYQIAETERILEQQEQQEEQQKQQMNLMSAARTGAGESNIPASQSYEDHRNFLPITLMDSSHHYSRQDQTGFQLV